ncbi:helix-turn-helix domain-containing protein [archaeon]|nr:helix-turn-helix domain-containing protein [archaeon]
MNYIFDDQKKTVVPTTIVTNEETLKSLTHPLRARILTELVHESMYPLQLSRKIGIHEQNIYYHIRALERAGLIKKDKTEAKAGTIAQYYTATKTAYSFIPNFVKSTSTDIKFQEYQQVPEILKSFIKDGNINCKIIVGAPYPHGELNRVEKCGHLAGDIAATLGKYGSTLEKLTYLDTEIDDLRTNLIIVSGLYVNTAQKTVNENLPIRFNESGTKILSDFSKEEYSEPEIGFIVRVKNPIDKRFNIIVLAGIEMQGTMAAVYAFTRYFSRIESGNMFDKSAVAKVIQAIENKGQVVDVRFLE